uniref:Fungal-type protein kinase domain-containing protein n=1 Tax=Ganoderma boninense TaxID=34458 RepID=A0A5K1K8L9_9APHY|nr:Uncharacterized protein [Ganoderma boninense]
MSVASSTDFPTAGLGTSPPPSPSAVSAYSFASGDQPAFDGDLPAIDPVIPAPQNPLPTAEPQLNSRPLFIRHCPSSTNRDAYNQKTGRELAPHLIDESGMGPRFHLLDNKLFSALLPVDPPTAAQRKKFKVPKLKESMAERDIYPQLVCRYFGLTTSSESDHHPVAFDQGIVIQSVLKAAKCKTLRFLDTANHKAKDGNRGRSETFNDAGIYRDNPRARDATDLDPKRRAKSKISAKQLQERILGARSWFWIDVPIEVKRHEVNSAFYFKTKPKKSWSDNMHPAAVGLSADEQAVGSETREDMEKEGDEENEDEDGDEDGEEDDDEEEETELEEARNAVKMTVEAYGLDEDDEEWEYDEDGDEEDEVSKVLEDGPDYDEAEDHEGGTVDEAFKVPAEDDGEDEVPENDAGAVKSNVPIANVIKKSVPPFIKLSGNGEAALGQFIEYQLNLFKYQHRTFSYSIYICFDMARLLYFDRAGAYVSQPFSWTAKSSLLHEFVWKFAQLANANDFEHMGHDTTAEMVSSSRRQKFFREAKNPELAEHVRTGLKKAIENSCPLYELTVETVPPSPDEWFPDDPFPEPSVPHSSSLGNSSSEFNHSTSQPAKGSTPSLRRFIVGRPHFSADALVGRCTRGYMAFDMTDDKKWVPCFLKDSWRPYVQGRTRPEHLVYERLRRMNVKKEDGIATLICGGDVGGRLGQRTIVQKDLPREKRPVPRIHYRLVIEEIGLPLSEFRNFGELSGIFADALKAHTKVWKDAKVLHRDISVGNIMIRVEGEKRTGFLIDWDLSRLESELGKGPVEPDRTGTWQFRSALSLLYPRKPYRRSDDVESFIHAYVYLILRHHVTNTLSVRQIAENYFEQASLIGGIKVGGATKFQLLQTGRVPFLVKGNPPLQALLHLLFSRCFTAYSNISETQMEFFYGPTENSELEEDVDELVFGRLDTNLIKEVSESSDEEGDRLLEQHYRMRLTARQSAPKDLFTLGKFLTSTGALINLFANHARQHSNANDKAPDQFIARRFQDPLDGPAPLANRRLATLSTSSSVAPQDDIGSVPDADVPAAGPSRRSLPQPSLNRNASAKRVRPTRTSVPAAPPGEMQGEPSSPERRKKRQKVPVKSRKGKAIRRNAS